MNEYRRHVRISFVLTVLAVGHILTRDHRVICVSVSIPIETNNVRVSRRLEHLKVGSDPSIVFLPRPFTTVV